MPEQFNTYHEPFLGGASVFFELHNRGLLAGKRVFLSDANAELINTYVVVRDRVDDLVAQLDILRALPHDEATYYAIRAQDPGTLTRVERAARTIYLNKAGFNGVYRVNRQGEFNVPYGRHKTLSIPEPDLLRADSSALQGAVISCTDFRTSLRNVKSGDLVYCDPPYDEAKFTNYTAGGFARADQEDLAIEFARLSALGAYVMMSNSDNGWVRQRYAVYRQELVMAPRSVNSDGEGRGLVPELIVIGWEPGTGAASSTVPTLAEASS